MDLDESEIQASYPDKFVCADCIDDDHLKAFIEGGVASRTCSYCGKRSQRKNIAAPIDDVIERMFEAIRRRHGEAWASGCSWDSEDDQYVNETWDTDDILQRYVDLPNDDSGALYQDICDVLGLEQHRPMVVNRRRNIGVGMEAVCGCGQIQTPVLLHSKGS